MREHPVPQDITGYNFHIIGEMTIKQFALVAGGAVFAFLVNMTNLPTFLKWPIMAVLAGAGALAAFVPIEEQPLDHWIVTFFKVLYKPTQYYWRRQAHTPDAFTFEQRVELSEADVPPDLSPAKKERVKEYLFSIDSNQPDEYDLYEQDRITQINQKFFSAKSNQAVPKIATTQPQIANINIKINPPKKEPQTRVFYGESEYLENLKPTKQTLKTNVQESNTAAGVVIPEQEIIELDERNTPVQTQVIDETQVSNEYQNTLTPVFNQNQTSVTAAPVEAGATVHNAALPFPSKPTIPNKIVGMVLSNNNELINDAIVEIKTNSGQVLRAVKSNSLGQFYISTPLKNGSYLISTEKNGFSFPQSQLILEGDVLDPIEIRSI